MQRRNMGSKMSHTWSTNSGINTASQQCEEAIGTYFSKIGASENTSEIQPLQVAARAAWRIELPSPTPNVASSLSPQELADHRARLIFEVKIVLSAYFQPTVGDQVEAATLAWWADELQDWTPHQARIALRRWNHAHPRTRPTPGDVVKILKALWAAKHRDQIEAARLQSQREPARQVPTPKRAEEILREVGFKLRA